MALIIPKDKFIGDQDRHAQLDFCTTISGGLRAIILPWKTRPFMNRKRFGQRWPFDCVLLFLSPSLFSLSLCTAGLATQHVDFEDSSSF